MNDWQPRFSVRTMLILVLAVAMGCAVWRAWPAIFFSSVVTLTCAALTAATIVAFFAGGFAHRAGSGFAICGWLYLLLTLGAGLGRAGKLLVTSSSLNRLGVWLTGLSTIDVFTATAAGHCLWATVIGLIGAFVAMSLGRSRVTA